MRSSLPRRSLSTLALTTAVAAAVAVPLVVTSIGQRGEPSPPARPLPTIVVAAAKAPATPLLKVGTRGRYVAWVQRRLKIEADGVFGPKTRKSVIAFQKSRRLEADGVVGPKTWKELRRPLTSCIVGTKRVISDSFGAPRSRGRKHMGIDVFAPYGSPVRAIAAGVVVRSYVSPMGGRAIIMSVGRDRYYYAHQAKNLVRTGQRVKVGQVIGRVGTSGNARGTSPHVHFERWRGKKGQIVDPYRVVRRVCDGR